MFSLELGLADDTGHVLVEGDLVVVPIGVSHEITVGLAGLVDLVDLLEGGALLAVEAEDQGSEAHELVLHLRPGVVIELDVVVLLEIVHLTTMTVRAGRGLILTRLLVGHGIVLARVVRHFNLRLFNYYTNNYSI